MARIPPDAVIERIIYTLILMTGSVERVIDVGRSYQTATGRMNHKRKNYNSWKRGYVYPSGKKAGKCEFYDVIEGILGDEPWFVDSLPQVTMRVEMKEVMNDFQADLMEGYFQRIVYPECMNVMTGDGHGKPGGLSKNHFGCVRWDKTRTKKKFRSSISLPPQHTAKRERNGQRKRNNERKSFDTIEEAHAWVVTRWNELKDEPHFQGYKPPQPLDYYKTHLGTQYDELNYLLPHN